VIDRQKVGKVARTKDRSLNLGKSRRTSPLSHDLGIAAAKKRIAAFTPDALFKVIRSHPESCSFCFPWRLSKSFIPAVYSVQLGDPQPSEKVAAFDFDGTLVNTAVRRHGADAWSLLFNTVPQKLQQLHNDGFRIVSKHSLVALTICTFGREKLPLQLCSRGNREPAFLSGMLNTFFVKVACLCRTVDTLSVKIGVGEGVHWYSGSREK
jgi:hypothetical protein